MASALLTARQAGKSTNWSEPAGSCCHGNLQQFPTRSHLFTPSHLFLNITLKSDNCLSETWLLGPGRRPMGAGTPGRALRADKGSRAEGVAVAEAAQPPTPRRSAHNKATPTGCGPAPCSCCSCPGCCTPAYVSDRPPARPHPWTLSPASGKRPGPGKPDLGRPDVCEPAPRVQTARGS